MSTKLLLSLLLLELLSEVFFGSVAVVDPAWGLGLFGVEVLPSTQFLSFVLGMALCFVSAMIALSMYGIWTGARLAWLLSLALGLFWIVFGGALFLVYGRTENLYLDLLPGLAVVGLTWRSWPREGRTRSA